MAPARHAKALIRFALVPDAGAARRLRRSIAEAGACSGVLVGTWTELLEAAVQAYLPVVEPFDWPATFTRTLADVEGFWSESLMVAPEETAVAIESAYTELCAATGLSVLPAPRKEQVLPARAAGRYRDLRRLAGALDGALPPELERARRILDADGQSALRCIRVERVAGFPKLTAAQSRLLEKLDGDAAADGDGMLHDLLSRLARDEGRASPGSALGAVQRQLFRPVTTPVALDASLQWVGCRDFLEEVEIAAGMVQRMLDGDSDLRPAQIGLLVPDDFAYTLALNDVFGTTGLALSGLSPELWRRDLGRETVLHFLYCRQKPSPAMAMAACLSSPLMPWPRDQGAALAQAVMGGDYRLRPPHGAEPAMRHMLALVATGDETPASLAAALDAFANLLHAPPGLEAHLTAARAASADLAAFLADRGSLDWRDLRRRVVPRHLPAEAQADFNCEGVTVWRESQEPWRAVRHLLVLGFAANHYPRPTARSPVFGDDEIASLAAACGLPLPSSADRLQARRERFRRQLAATAEDVTFLVPRRAPDGTATGLSDSHAFIADVLGRAADAGDLVMDVDDPEQRARVRHLAEAAPARATPARAVERGNLELGTDLMALRVDDSGRVKPESPSELETLMVSPLAWLLRRLGTEPALWQPERADPAVLGQLAHAVFERLFAPGVDLPQRESLEQRVAVLLDEGIAELAPFLRAAQWQVERSQLVGSLSRAARAWCEVLERLGARILAGEVWLAGQFHDIAVHGQADVILGLDDDRLLVVDYKRASATVRRERMQAGYDSQASLYRMMIETGGPKEAEDTELRHRLTGTSDIGIVYYLLNDQTALSDTPLPGGAAIPGWEVVDADVSGVAVALIERRVDEVRAGRVVLNGAEDEAYFDKTARVGVYAFDVSPLVRLHLREGLSEGLE